MIDEDAPDIRTLLTDANVPPIGVDLSQVVRAGERTVARRRIAEITGGAALAAVVVAALLVIPLTGHRGTGHAPAAGPATRAPAAPSPASSPTGSALARCTLSRLPLPPGVKAADAQVIDPTGRYIAGTVMAGGENFTTILWTDGVPKLLHFASSVQITSINGHGVAVGLAANGRSPEWVFRYDHGTVNRMPTPPGTWNVYPEPRINARGDIVINAEPVDQPDSAKAFTIVWKGGSLTPTRIHLPKHAEVDAITDDGTLVGSVFGGSGGQASGAYAWDFAGHGVSLAGGGRDQPVAVSGDRAVGDVDLGSIAVWDLRTGAVTVTPKIAADPSVDVEFAINASGWLLDGRSIVYQPGSQSVLPPVRPGDIVWSLGIADNGAVVGYSAESEEDDNSTVPVEWHC